MMKWLIISFCFLLTACHTNKQSSQEDSNNKVAPIEKLAAEKFGDNYFIVYNITNRYGLVKSKKKKFSEIGFDITYFIFDNQTNEIIIEDFLKSGYVDWEDEYTIKAVNRKIGKDKKRNKEVYLYNVEARERREVELRM